MAFDIVLAPIKVGFSHLHWSCTEELFSGGYKKHYAATQTV